MITVEIEATPIPKGRPRLNSNGVVYTPRRTKEFEELIGWYTKAFIKKPYETPIKLLIDIYSRTRADIDNLAKSIMDGLNGVAYIDDRQVIDLRIRKFNQVGKEKIIINLEEIIWQITCQMLI